MAGNIVVLLGLEVRGLEPALAARGLEGLRVGAIRDLVDTPSGVIVVACDPTGAEDPVQCLRDIHAKLPAVPVVVVSANVSGTLGFQFAREGASDVLDPSTGADSVAERLLELAGVRAVRSAPRSASSSSNPIDQEIARAARVRATVLLRGETGTGKGLIAERIHAASEWRERAFVHVDCASLTPTLIESELFGHERGAFTGAERRRPGRFELAGNGTIFLDEIGDLDGALQSKLLRVLEHRIYERVGGTETLLMGARVIAATSVDLMAAMREKRFRRDLYYRLDVIRIDLPPLRSRISELPDLLAAGLDRVAPTLGLPVPEVHEDFLARLERHRWPGNVRELFNVLERVLVRQPVSALRASDLDGVLPDDTRDADASPVFDPDNPDDVRAVLRETGGNIARASRRLGLAESTLRYRVKSHPDLSTLIPDD